MEHANTFFLSYDSQFIISRTIWHCACKDTKILGIMQIIDDFSYKRHIKVLVKTHTTRLPLGYHSVTTLNVTARCCMIKTDRTVLLLLTNQIEQAHFDEILVLMEITSIYMD